MAGFAVGASESGAAGVEDEPKGLDVLEGAWVGALVSTPLGLDVLEGTWVGALVSIPSTTSTFSTVANIGLSRSRERNRTLPPCPRLKPICTRVVRSPRDTVRLADT
jgi:hypothetical protein